MNPSAERRALIGSYFCHEYSVEAAALFNPSIVKHPDQSSLTDGALRFVMSLRAVGEGHISSIEFRTGVVYPGGCIDITPPKKPLREPVCSISRPGEKVIMTRKVRGSGRLVESDSVVAFDTGTELSQRVLFPFMACQRNGIEDARFMEFRDEEGKRIFYATYTAYDGKHIRPKLLSTEDFRTFRFMSLLGSGVKNK
ncbi:MAG: glycosidase, partial [Spirochaetaceae bacterium]|nr:glycosidase [Spirochaetaceae bacterium]